MTREEGGEGAERGVEGRGQSRRQTQAMPAAGRVPAKTGTKKNLVKLGKSARCHCIPLPAHFKAKGVLYIHT